MSFRPFLVTAVRARRVAPLIQRVTFTGVDDMGPACPILDLRIKLIIPGDSGLPELPVEGWWDAWRDLPAEQQGFLRTYSIRELRRVEDGPDELDVDFVVHTHNPGPASGWAAEARPGDQIIVIGPSREDACGTGIEFAPGTASLARLYGDETALPAIARILEDWPAGLFGSADIEVPAGNRLSLRVPTGVDVAWHMRKDAHRGHGNLLHSALAKRISARPAGGQGDDGCPEEVWETPFYSSSGEDIGSAHDAGEDTYYWIAGKNTFVATMRRLLVTEAGVPRHRVSFMGYWR